MEKSCFRKEECKLFKEAQPCSGCGFQHYADVLKAHGNILSVKEIGDRYFKYIPEHRGVREGKVSTGGRVAIDVPLREFMENKLPQLQSIERKKLTLHLKGENFIPKADGIFKTKNASKYLFYEIKGYGDDTNSILSAITAAKLLSLVDEKIDSYYYYIGICSGSKKMGEDSKEKAS